MRRLVAAAFLLTVGAVPARAQLQPTGPNLLDPNVWDGCPGLEEANAFCLRPTMRIVNPGDTGPDDIALVPDAPAVTSQTFASLPGQQYFLDFAVNQGSDFPFHFWPAEVQVSWDGQLIVDWSSETEEDSFAPADPRGILLFASGATTTLTFSSQMLGPCNGSQCINISNVTGVHHVSVREAALITPEPATLASVAGGLLVLGVAARRRARRLDP